MAGAAQNIVLVTVDCFRYDRCGFAGHHRNTTPFLDELASESTVFDAAYASGPDTSESFPGILAGRLSGDCVYVDSPTRKAIPADAETLASHLRQHGYETAATISNPQLTRRRNFDAGFDRFENLRVPEAEEKNTSGAARERESDVPLLRRLSVGERLYQFRERLRGRDSLPAPYRLPMVALREYQYRTEWPTVQSDEILERAGAAIAEATEPFFLWVHLMDLHGPLHPDTVNAGGLCRATRRKQFAWDADRMADIQQPACGLRYDSALRRVDSQLSGLHDRLQSEGFAEETAFIVTGDHGESLHDRGLYGHRHHYLYDDLLHVPLLVNRSGAENAAKRVQTPVSLAWLHRLATDIAGVPPGPFPQTPDGDLFCEPDEDFILSDSIGTGGHSVAVRHLETGIKQIYHSGNTEGLEGAADRRELYDVQLDRGERTPLNPDRIEGASRLTERSESLVIHPDELPELDETLSEETEDRLRELGYLK
jgi:choline-sulfatase